MENKMRYISSKMSGLPDYNFAGFRRKQEELIFKGHHVFNPADHEPDKNDAMWSEFLAQDIINLEIYCNSIHMWGKWYRSQGACVEMLSAHRLGYKIHIEQWWLKWVPSVMNKIFQCKTKGFNNG